MAERITYGVGAHEPIWHRLRTGNTTADEWERWERIEALLPESGLHGLDAELRSLSQGLASYAAGFDHLSELSGKEADQVVKARAEVA